MREQTLRDFFVGAATAQELARDVAGTIEFVGPDTSRQRITDMDQDFELRTEHLIRLCDAVLAGALPAELLAPIVFCLVASDRFAWDTDDPASERVAETVHDWSAPQVNYVLNSVTAAKFRHYLLTGERNLTRDDLWSENRPRSGLTTRRKDATE